MEARSQKGEHFTAPLCLLTRLEERRSATAPKMPTFDLSDHHFPLHYFQSEPIPPSPTRSQSAIDFLPDFSGHAWIGYGASSLLVISHFPSPLSSNEEALIGPIFRQVFELSGNDESVVVNAVSWSPVTPSKGEIAAAANNCISLFSHDSANVQGSFCWSQTAVLVQASKVEAIKWTGSGDGIVAGGIEVILWKNRDRSWEIAWKFKTQQPQTQVSATWTIQGPSATVAAYLNEEHVERSSSVINEAGKCVSVCQSGEKCEYVKTELRHPQPVSMIQWRPITGRQLIDAKQPPRHVLVTCCLDGTVRLWCEIDHGRPKKIGKDINDQKILRRSFCVAAVIDTNQTLNGTLGKDIFIAWATEIRDVTNTCEGAKQYFSTEKYEGDNVGRCEWLIGFGPGMLLTFWAIHCLDEFSPVRFPRVTLWKRQEVRGLEMVPFYGTGDLNPEEKSLYNKVVISRNQHCGPPTMCSLIQLVACNSLGWSLLYTQTTNNIGEGVSQKEDLLSCKADRFLNVDGHCGKILQVSVHPYSSEIELAVSLDSNGLLLFWSLSTISNCTLGLAQFNPAWSLCGKLVTASLCSRYTSLAWAPSLLDEDLFLLMGHAGGIDCFVVKVSQSEKEKVVCHNLCKIHFTSHTSRGDGPTNMFSTPLLSTCDKAYNSCKFILFGVWMKNFQALSWEITVHSFDLSGSFCECTFGNEDFAQSGLSIFETAFAGKRYCLVVNPCSSQLQDTDAHYQVESFTVVTPDNLITSIQQSGVSDNVVCCNIPAYHLATGYSDGSVRLWRSNHTKSTNPHSQWELVGGFAAHQGPIRAISVTDCGQKIAIVCLAGQHKDVCSLHIWDSVNLTDTGSFILEDMLSLDGHVIALSWLSTGNGQLLLGVCMKNELQVYAQRHCGGQSLLKSEKSLEMHIWFCIAVTQTSSPIYDFFWGPGATAVVVHGDFFCLYGPWVSVMDKQHKGKCNSKCSKCPLVCKDGGDENMLPEIFSDCDIGDLKEYSLMENSSIKCKCRLPINVNVEEKHSSDGLFMEKTQVKCGLGILEVAEKLKDSLPAHHPEALLMNIFSGNWKRAHISVRHLAKFLNSGYAVEGTHSSASCSGSIPLIPLTDYFDGQLLERSTDLGFQWSTDATSIPSSLAKSEPSSFIEPIEKLYDLEGIANIEKTQILAIIDLLNEIDNPHCASVYESLDEPGRRFWAAVRFRQLYFHRRFGRLASTEELLIDSSFFVWAFHSDCQDNLFSSVLPNEPSWQEMRTMGIGFWFTNEVQLRTKMEKLARLQYLKNKDPKSCALLYIALNRLQVLAGLFKISKDEKDKPLVGFLSRNFQEEKHKAAALKNAYVLMGRHQLELAIAFFLLGGDTSSAVAVCAKNLGDEQLALVICRLVEGHGGPLEQHLISKHVLPASLEKGDYWLASLLEWELGNYSQSFLIMLGVQKDPGIAKSSLSSLHCAFLDPSIGQYCLTLATKNSMRNAIGEQNAAILCRWATLMRATALNRCGLPLEGLECLSFSQSTYVGGSDRGSVSSIENSGALHSLLKPSPSESFNWLSSDVAYHLESLDKIDLAMKYLSKLMVEHPDWSEMYAGYSGAITCPKEYELHQYEILLDNFRNKLYMGLATFEQKFALVPAFLISRILVSSWNKGLFFVGYDILCGYTSQEHSQPKSCMVDNFLLHPIIPKQLLKATKEISSLFSRFIVASNINCSRAEPYSIENGMHGENRSGQSGALANMMQGVVQSLWYSRAVMRIFHGCAEDLIKNLFLILDLYEYCAYFASTWLQRNVKGLILMVQPLLTSYSNGHTLFEVDMDILKNLRCQIAKLVFDYPLTNCARGSLEIIKQIQDGGGEIKSTIPADERWEIIGTYLWRLMSIFIKHQLNLVSGKFEDCFSGALSSWSSISACSKPDLDVTALVRLVSVFFSELLKITLELVSSYHAKELASFLWQKVEDRSRVPTLTWLETSSQSEPLTPLRHLSLGTLTLDMMNNDDNLLLFGKLWDICADAKIIFEGFAQENINVLQNISKKPSIKWLDIYKVILTECEAEDSHNHDGRHGSNSASGQGGPTPRGLFWNGPPYFLSSRQKEITPKEEDMHFQNPKEIYRRNGELFEALCVNSIDQRQAALASNRKGILFFHWEDAVPFRDQSDFVWSEADWPQNGWAGSESTPVPTCVSPGVGLANKKGAHRGLGGATIGVGSLARPGRDLTGGGAFGIPGYAGIGASGLGWEVQEEFEEFVDPPATVENIRTRAFSSHPSRPFFLVGSSNTHIYLWEFGKDKGIATYGVLPAANVPPPYALASISAVQFDQCGHRFATAALDGTICTWQLEVGGRSNVCPTESSLSFNGYASDVTYLTTSGSIICAAGYSTDGVNVVVWDTLAPVSTSRASIMCHEGGARSLSVFDNDVGSGSISPLLVTGGKSGDIGLHDFRYIATGRTKRHRQNDSGEHNVGTSSTADTGMGMPKNTGDQNKNGMLWYIPKAHLGSVTKISTIPNTSLFLTGSKDGDVKLWDAKKARLVYHWPKLHERHTFLQPSSRGFGGVVQAAVTDIKVVSHGFLSCGGDGSVKLVKLKEHLQGT